MRKLWKKFKKLSSDCYSDMIRPGMDAAVWDAAFSVLVEIVNTGRSEKAEFAADFYQLDDDTDFEYDVSGWLEDYLDELDMNEHYEKLQEVCETMLMLFQWKEEDPSEYRFLISSAKRSQGKDEEALSYCEDWYKDEPENMLAAVALVYSRIAVKDFGGAEQIIGQYISEDTVCMEENDIIFTAAERLYQASGDKAAEKRISQKIKTYEERLEEEWLGMDDDDEVSFDDEDFPFS